MRIRLGSVRVCLISGAHHITSIFKASRDLGSKPGLLIALNNILGTPKHIIPFYAVDDSGVGLRPHPDSHVDPEHRIGYFQHKAAHKYLTGQELKSMSDRYLMILQRNLSELRIGNEWRDFPDLNTFIQTEVSRAVIESMCGTYILSLNPSLISDFWQFDRSVPLLYKGLPQWLCPSAYKARERMLASIKKWHKYSHEHSDCTRLGPADPEWDPFWGSKLVKARQEYGLRMGTLDADALAAEDLGLLFA